MSFLSLHNVCNVAIQFELKCDEPLYGKTLLFCFGNRKMLLIITFCRAFKHSKLSSGLHCMKLFPANGRVSDVFLIQQGPKSFFSIKSGVRTKAALLSGEGDLRSHPNGINVAAKSTLLGDISAGIGIQPDAIALGTLAAETTPTTIGFPSDNGEFDLDLPTKGFSSIPEAIEDIRQGKVGYLLNFFVTRIEAVFIYHT